MQILKSRKQKWEEKQLLDMGETQTNGPKDKEIKDYAQDFTPKR